MGESCAGGDLYSALVAKKWVLFGSSFSLVRYVGCGAHQNFAAFLLSCDCSPDSFVFCFIPCRIMVGSVAPEFAHIINGKAVFSERTAAIVNPATGQHLADVPIASEQQLDDAVDAAQEAFPAWASKTYEQRANVLLEMANIIETRADDYKRLLTAEQGKPVSPRSISQLPLNCTDLTSVSRGISRDHGLCALSPRGVSSSDPRDRPRRHPQPQSHKPTCPSRGGKSLLIVIFQLQN